MSTQVMTLVQAVNHALDLKLAEDPAIVVYGEDVGLEGGVFRATEGLQARHGEARVFDSPLAESGIMGTAVGMAAAGLRPVVEIQFCGFLYPAFNQLVCHVARMRNRTRGKYPMRLVVRFPYGGNIRALEQHSESPEALLAHTPGLKVVIPSTPYDAKGLLIAAIESDDPVIFMEPKRIYRAVKQEVPLQKYTLPIGKAKVLAEGTDITVVTYGANVRETQKALALAKKDGISAELIDLRTIYPVDRATIAASVRKTGRFLAVTGSTPPAAWRQALVTIVNEEAFLVHSRAPARLAGSTWPAPPYARGEHFYFSPSGLTTSSSGRLRRRHPAPGGQRHALHLQVPRHRRGRPRGQDPEVARREGPAGWPWATRWSRWRPSKVVADIPLRATAPWWTAGAVGEIINVGDALIELEIEGITGAEEPRPSPPKNRQDPGAGGRGGLRRGGHHRSGRRRRRAPRRQRGLRRARAEPRRARHAPPVSPNIAREARRHRPNLAGTGPGGRVMKSDIQAHLDAQRHHPSPRPRRARRGSRPGAGRVARGVRAALHDRKASPQRWPWQGPPRTT